MKIKISTQLIQTGTIVLTLLAVGMPAKAEPVPFNGILDIFANDPTWGDALVVDDGETEPGSGGQDFDAEYLFGRMVGTTLEIGLQAGFNLITGKVGYGGLDYYAGDLAIRTPATGDYTDDDYEFAVDFGLKTMDYKYASDATPGVSDNVDIGSGDGIDPEGLYSVTEWNNDVVNQYTASSPFAMDGGELIAGGLVRNDTGSGEVGGYTSYYRIVGIDTAALGINPLEMFTLDVHWTMSCGNDEVLATTFFVNGGEVTVPEPSISLLMLFGLLCIASSTARRRRFVAVG